jgi:glycerophosphoryl diester phosphodiesterase
MKRRPLIIAHRGFSGKYPENTLAAFRAALALGVDMVEIDVHETRDGELIVFHDYRLERLCGVRGRVRDVTRSELRRLNPAVPTLADVLRVCHPGRGGPRGARVLVEIKRADPRKVAAAIVRQRMEREVIIFSQSVPRMKTFAAANPRIVRFGLIARNLRPSLHALRSTLNVDGLGLSRRLVTSPRVVCGIHRRGWKLFVWTVNRAADMRRFADWGVDGIITNRPDVAKSCLAPR